MKRIITILLLLLWFLLETTQAIGQQKCKKICVRSFKSQNGTIDKFELSELVIKKFSELGFEVACDENINNDCLLFVCQIEHSENYWQAKNDVVRLTITNNRNNEVLSYESNTGVYILTFRSGYRKAIKSLLTKIK